MNIAEAAIEEAVEALDTTGLFPDPGIPTEFIIPNESLAHHDYSSGFVRRFGRISFAAS